jgi:hypothetical protein
MVWSMFIGSFGGAVAVVRNTPTEAGPYGMTNSNGALVRPDGTAEDHDE